MSFRAASLLEFQRLGLWMVAFVAACSSPASPPSKDTMRANQTDGATAADQAADGGATCTRDRTGPAGKFSAADQAIWEASASPVEVLITVKGGATVTPLPTCPERDATCAPAEAATSMWSAENLASQKCVRELIIFLGGTPHQEVFWLVNDFVADLTWAQIQVVATHPDVVSIAPNVSTMGPPARDGGPA